MKYMNIRYGKRCLFTDLVIYVFVLTYLGIYKNLMVCLHQYHTRVVIPRPQSYQIWGGIESHWLNLLNFWWWGRWTYELRILLAQLRTARGFTACGASFLAHNQLCFPRISPGRTPDILGVILAYTKRCGKPMVYPQVVGFPHLFVCLKEGGFQNSEVISSMENTSKRQQKPWNTLPSPKHHLDEAWFRIGSYSYGSQEGKKKTWGMGYTSGGGSMATSKGG